MGCRAASSPRASRRAVRCGSACPRTGPSARTSRPWANPERVHADVVAAPEVIHSCTGLTPSCAQDLGRQQGACGRQQRGNRVARHPLQVAPPLLTDHRHGARDRGLCPWPGAAWWAGRCSSRRCRRSPTRSYHSAENACRRPAMPRRRCRVVRHDNGFLALPRGPGDRALPGVFFLAWTSMNRSCRLRIRRRRGPRGPPRGPAGWDCEVRIVRHHLIALSWHPFRAQGGAATTSGASLRRSAVFAVGRRRFHSAK